MRLKTSKKLMNVVCVLLTASLILLTCACQIKKKPPTTAAEVILAMLDAVTVSYPQGKVRTLTSEKETDRLSVDLLTALYGSTAGQWYQQGNDSILDDGAIYLSEVMHPFELAVFRCVDERDVDGGMASVLGLCSARLDVIRNTWQGSAYESYVGDAVVTYCQGFVLLVVAEDPDTVVKAAEKVIRSR